MYVCLCLHVEWSIIRLSPEMAYSRGSRYEHRARLALPIHDVIMLLLNINYLGNNVKFRKLAPVFVSKLQLPTFVFTEDYQVDFLKQYHSIFDIFKKEFLVGEMVWNFADFMTDQSK